MDYVVSLLEVSKQPFAAARTRSSVQRISKEIGPLLGHVWEFLGKHPGLRADGGRNVAVYCRPGESNSVEVGVEVKEHFTETDLVVYAETPAGRAAQATHVGPYAQLGEAHQAVRSWCAAKGYALASTSWEIYGHWDADPAKLRTDVFYLLQ